jgi:hypothetical protein
MRILFNTLVNLLQVLISVIIEGMKAFLPGLSTGCLMLAAPLPGPSQAELLKTLKALKCQKVI